MSWNPVCFCGHVEEEHEQGFFKPCTLCGCDDFNPDDSDYTEDD